MKTLSYLFSVLIAAFCISLNAYSQEVTTEQKENISSEIAAAFENSVRAAENLNAKLLADGVDDNLQAGFIINGQFFRLFSEVMNDFKGNAKGCKISSNRNT